MAYRRKTYKKRFMKRKKKTFKKRFTKKYRANKTTAYNGQVNVKADMSIPMTQYISDAGCKIVICWGNPSSTFTSAPYNWDLGHVVSHENTMEWNHYFDEYQEYRIVGVKIRVIPCTYIGDQGDARALRQLHIGSSNEVMSPANLTVNRFQYSSDYKGYSMNAQTPEVKRYYKPYLTNKRKGDAVWQITGIAAYSSAITYLYWQVSGVDTNSLVLGDVNVQFYIQFRKPKMSLG